MRKQLFLFLLLLVLFTGCAHDYYYSSIQNVPLFREKYEFHLTGAYAIGEESQSGEMQTAFSVTNHLGIMANFMKTKVGSFAKEDYVSLRNGDFAIGYFRPVGKIGIVEIYSGLGLNEQHHGYSTEQYNQTTGKEEYISSGKSDIHYTRYYIQPSFGISFDYFEAAASLRISQLRFTSVDYDVSDHTEDILLMDMLSEGLHYIVEPSLTIRSGWKNVKIQCQASYAVNHEYFNDEDEVNNYVEPLHFSMGIYFRLVRKSVGN